VAYVEENVIGNDNEKIKESKQDLITHFQIKDLIQLLHFLEIKVYGSRGI